MNEIKLSAVVITFNEEKNIAACLKSLQAVADEIIVLDSFSTDRTKKICEQFDVQFVTHSFDGYTAQKNRADKLAKHDFILSLDADELLSDELKQAILEVKKNSLHDAYFFNRLNHYCGKAIRVTDWYPDRKLRLWNKNKGQWEGDFLHEKVVLQVGTSTKFLEGDLLHYSFASIEEHILQANKFSSIAAAQLVSAQKKGLFFRLLLNPFFKFFKNYVLKRGFLAGWYGFIISNIIAFETFLKYAKAIHLKFKKKGNF